MESTTIPERRPVLCPWCERENPAGSHFCNRCGAPIVAPHGDSLGLDGHENELAALKRQVQALTDRVIRLEMVQLPEDLASLRRERAWPGKPSMPVAGRPRWAGLAAALRVDWAEVVRHRVDVAEVVRHGVDVAARAARQSPVKERLLVAAAPLLLGPLLFALAPLLWAPGLAGLRQQVNRVPMTIALLASVGLAILVAVGMQRSHLRWGALRDSGGVILALALAVLGEGQLLSGKVPPGIALYLAAVAVAWWQARRHGPLDKVAPSSFAHRYQFPLLAAALVVGAFTRLYQIGSYPYGYEGDETKWAYGIVRILFGGEPHAWPAEAAFKMVPTTFYTEAVAFQLLGMSIWTARLQVALLSIGANVGFYFLARRVVGVPAALVATFLLGVCVTDVSASRISDPEGQVKLWAVLAPLFLLRGLDTRRLLPFLLSGVSLAAGLGTYDTFYPMAAVMGLYLLWSMMRWRDRWLDTAKGSVLLALPVLLVWPSVQEDLNIRGGWYQSALQSGSGYDHYSMERLASQVAFMANNLGDLLASLFIRQRWGDFLVNRDGPVISALLVPFLVLGVAWALKRVREAHNGFLLLWIALAFFPTGIILGTTWVRVFYPSYPALYILVGVGVWWSYSGLRGMVPARWQTYLAGGLVAFLMGVGVVNTYIYFRELQDPVERVARRDLGDAVAGAIAPGGMVYVAYQPLRGDFVETENPFVQFVARGKVGIGQEQRYYQYVPYVELLQRISRERGQYQEVKVVAAARQYDFGSDRVQVLAALQASYPDTTVTDRQNITVYSIPRTALANPARVTDTQARLLQPTAGAPLKTGEAVNLAWAIDRGDPRQFRLQVERFNDRVYPIEAETFSSDQGWAPENRYVGDFTGSGYLADNYKAGTSSARFQVPVAGRYQIWVRTYRRVADDTHVNFDPGTGSGPVEIARSDPARINRWVWESVGSYDLAAAPLQMSFSKEYGKAQHMSIFIDAVLFSRDGQFNPSEQGQWSTILDAGPMAATSTSFRWETPAPQPGRYRWRLQLLDGDRLVDSLGRQGIWVDYQEFQIAR